MNILVVRLSALGDVIHTFPAVTQIRRVRPDVRITWLVEDSASALVHGHPAVDRVLVWPRSTWREDWKAGRVARLIGSIATFVRSLRDSRYDLVVDFQGLLKSAVWVSLARARRKAGYGPGQRHDEFGWLALNQKIPVTARDAHAVERNLRLVEALGFPRQPLAYELPVTEPSEAEAERLLASSGIPSGTRFVAVHSVTRWPTKNWTPRHFSLVAERLLAAGVPIVLTGGGGDRVFIDGIVSSLPGRPPVRLDGKTSLPVLTAIFRKAWVLLSTDTGPMHLAAAVGTPVVALFGPTSPTYTGPHGESHEVLRSGVSCSPCFRRECRTRDHEPHACMLRLDPEQVTAKVLEVFRRRRNP